MKTQKFNKITFQTFGDGFVESKFGADTNFVLAAIMFLVLDGIKRIEKDFVIQLSNNISIRSHYNKIKGTDEILKELSECELIQIEGDNITVTEKLLDRVSKKYGKIVF